MGSAIGHRAHHARYQDRDESLLGLGVPDGTTQTDLVHKYAQGLENP